MVYPAETWIILILRSNFWEKDQVYNTNTIVDKTDLSSIHTLIKYSIHLIFKIFKTAEYFDVPSKHITREIPVRNHIIRPY